uniref:LITAF domain-containing protein n=1 Tax=Meloidogyne incognita TaxID=6306 RepID=A0A914L7G6_MELIC
MLTSSMYMNDGYGSTTTYAQFFGPKPQLVHCPTCNQNTKTKLEFITGRYTYLDCFVILLFGLFISAKCFVLFLKSIDDGGVFMIIFFIMFSAGLGLCCFSIAPFYMNKSKDAKHYCSECNNYVGKYIRNPRRPVVILPPESYKHKVYQPKNNLLETV